MERNSICYSEIKFKKLEMLVMMPKKSPMSHTVPTRLTSDLPNTEIDFTKSTGVVPTKDPPKVKPEESSNNVREYEL